MMKHQDIPTRAKAGWIETTREGHNGHKPTRVKTNIVPSNGMFSTKEMEKTMQEVAKDVGASEDQIRIQAYQQGEAPLETNPRHRGLGHHWNKPVSEPIEVNKPRDFIKVRRVYSGWEPPTLEELQEFEARRKLLTDAD